MSKLVKLLRKLAAGEFSELNDRAREEWIRRQEKSHYRKGDRLFQYRNYDEIFTAHFLSTLQSGESSLSTALKNRDSHAFPGFKNRSLSTEWGVSLGQDKRNSILDRAKQICEDKFPIFSLGYLDFGSPPSWHLDPVNGREAPQEFYGDIEFLDANVVGDSKVTWELSRWQFVYDLGQAYLLSGDEKYPEKFFKLIISWDESHPDYQGIAFCSSLEFAFRLNSLIWGIEFFRSSAALNESAARTIYRLLHLSGTFLENHLSRHFAPNTHLFGEGWGLSLLGLLFPEFAASTRWYRIGLEIVESELDKQFTSDGFHAELSTAYHAYCIEIVFTLISAHRSIGRSYPDRLFSHLQEMVRTLRQLQRPDGCWPHVGDEDGGRILFLSRVHSHDFNPILEAAETSLTNDATSQHPCSFAETPFLTGTSTAKNSAARIDCSSAATIAGGAYNIIRADHSQYLLFQAGKFGYLECPHSHADMLQIDFSAGPDNFLVDPGTYVYTGDPKSRNTYRSGAVHNGPHINEIYAIDDPFAWKQEPDCRLIHKPTPDDLRASARYELNAGGSRTSISRTVEYLGDGLWWVTDNIDASSTVTVSWRFTTPYAVEEDQKVFAINGNHSTLRLLPVCISGTFNTKVIETEISTDYLSSRKATAICARLENISSIRVGWILQIESAASDRILSATIRDETRIKIQTTGTAIPLEFDSAAGESVPDKTSAGRD